MAIKIALGVNMSNKDSNTEERNDKKTSKDQKPVEVLEKDYFGTKDDHAEHRTISSRERLRGQLNNEVEEFLNKGGTISEIDAHVTADPPKKPGSNYGSHPI